MDICIPKNDELPFLDALVFLQRLTLGNFDKKHSNCTRTQLTIFIVLHRFESLTMSQVAEYISSSNEQATRAVAPLVDMGYVERFIAPENRTKVHVRLTPTGRAYVEKQMIDFYRQINERLDGSLDMEEKLRFCQAVRTITAIAGKVK